jgi:hypothetical protein
MGRSAWITADGNPLPIPRIAHDKLPTADTGPLRISNDHHPAGVVHPLKYDRSSSSNDGWQGVLVQSQAVLFEKLETDLAAQILVLWQERKHFGAANTVLS